MYTLLTKDKLVIAFVLMIFGISVPILNNLLQADVFAAEQDDYAELYAKDSNISVEEALVRIGWQDKASTLNDTLDATLPSSDYGGIWIDGETGRINVGIVENSATDGRSVEKLLEETKDLDLSEAIDIVPVTYSLETLVNTSLAIRDLHRELVADKTWPINMGLNIDHNKVLVEIPQEQHFTQGHRQVLNEIAEHYEDLVVYETYTERAVSEGCNDFFCDNPLRGGIGIWDDNLACTAGALLQNPNNGNVYILTAGHCYNPGGGTWVTHTTASVEMDIGTVTNSLYNNSTPIDAMIINTNNTEFASKTGKIFKRDSTTAGANWSSISGYNDTPPSYDELYDLTTNSTSVEGERICISPAASADVYGGTCGEVEDLSVWKTLYDDYYGNVQTLTHKAGYCSQSGDSGSPIFASGNKLKGIHRGSSGDHGDCSHFKYYTPIATILIGFDDEGIPLEVW